MRVHSGGEVMKHGLGVGAVATAGEEALEDELLDLLLVVAVALGFFFCWKNMIF